MEFPQELRWIGPLFALLFFLLWSMRGPRLFFILFVIPLLLMIYLPQFLIVGSVVAFLIYQIKEHRFTLIVLFLSFFSSGIFLEPIPIPYVGSYQPIPDERMIIFLTPFYFILSLPYQFLSASLYLDYISSILLLTLPILTVLTLHLVNEGKLGYVQAILVFVMILLTWTLSVIPLGYSVSYTFLTPVPIGPLIALNILPWVKITESVD